MWCQSRLVNFILPLWLKPPPIHLPFLLSRHRRVLPPELESLEFNLSLRSLNRIRGIGIDEAAAELAVLERCSLRRAHAGALAVVGTAGRRAIVVGDAAACDELLSVAATDVPGTGVVGNDLSESRDGNCLLSPRLAYICFVFYCVFSVCFFSPFLRRVPFSMTGGSGRGRGGETYERE